MKHIEDRRRAVKRAVPQIQVRQPGSTQEEFLNPVPMSIYYSLEEPELRVRRRAIDRPGAGGFYPKWCWISSASNDFFSPLRALKEVKVVEINQVRPDGCLAEHYSTPGAADLGCKACGVQDIILRVIVFFDGEYICVKFEDSQENVVVEAGYKGRLGSI